MDAAVLLLTVAELDEAVEDYDSAGVLLDCRARRLRELYGDADARTLDAMAHAARVWFLAGRYREAISLAGAELAHRDRGEASDPAHILLARAMDGLGNFDGAEPHWSAVFDSGRLLLAGVVRSTDWASPRYNAAT